jgi:D-aminoacyl-tRNA deacylase
LRIAMRLIVTSKEDIASMNIRDKLLRGWSWKETGEFEGAPLLEHQGFLMAAIPEIHLERDHIDRQVKEASGKEFDAVVFASRHRAESKIPTLTVHPIGNFAKADFGGLDGKLVRASPHLMTSSLRALREKAGDLGFGVSFETTHHGPYLETPSFFIEIGSDESFWTHEKAAERIADAIMTTEAKSGKVVMGVGGGHYAPRFTDLAMDSDVSIAHMAANYALDSLMDETIMREMIEKSGSPKLVYFHRKSMPKPKYRALEEKFAALGIESVRSDDLS